MLDLKSKQDKVKVTNLKKIAKNSTLEILQKTLHAPHLLKLLDKIYKYEMDPTSIVEVTEQTQFHPQMDGQPYSRMDDVKPEHPLSTLLKQGV